jgi:hypothetical protein
MGRTACPNQTYLAPGRSGWRRERYCFTPAQECHIEIGYQGGNGFEGGAEQVGQAQQGRIGIELGDLEGPEFAYFRNAGQGVAKGGMSSARHTRMSLPTRYAASGR